MDRDRWRLRLDDPVLFRGYDSRSIERGIRYATEGRVEIIEADSTGATAHVAGSAAEPYVVDVDWSGLSGGRAARDWCSCPLGGGCKHAVAVLVTVAPRTSTPPDSSTQQRPHLHSLPGGLARSGPSREASISTWRMALSGVAAPDAPHSLPLALQFNLQMPRTSSYTHNPPLQLLVRPMRMGAKGKWIKSGAGWREITSGYGWDLDDTDPAHLAALRTLAVGHSSFAYSSNNGPVPIERLGPTVWSGLRSAAEAGVSFIDDHGLETVQLSEAVGRTAIDLTATPDGGAAMSVGITVEEAAVDLSDGEVCTIGSPPHGLCRYRDDRLELVELDRPVHTGVAELLGGPPLHVPAHDLDELIDDYQPRLAKVAEVRSSDGSITIEETRLDGLVACVEHHSVAAAHLSWAARYRRGDRVRLHPLAGSAGSGRDPAAERALAQELELPTDLLAGLVGPLGGPVDLSVRGNDAVVLLTDVVPWLADRGQVTVEVTGDAPELRESTQDPLIALGVADPDDADGANDWFDLSVEVTLEGERIPFAELFRALTFDEEVLVLPSGTWLRLDHPQLAQLRELVLEARGLADRDAKPDGSGDDPDGRLRINRFQASWWEDLAAIGVVEQQSQRWADSIARLRDLSAPAPVEPSPHLAAKLRPYQQDGLDWLAFLHRSGLGGILADDMGLGKTIQTLALFLHVLDRDPDSRFLVVAPTSVVENWHREAAQFAPDVDVATIRATEARRGCDLGAAVADARIVVTSYALFRLEFDGYQSIGWNMLVLDEAQFVKNHRGKTYQCARRLQADTKLAITGTPLENSVMDLWSLLSITAPGLYPDPQRFAEVYRKPIESGKSPEPLARLRRRIAPLMRRRTKDEVLTDLPPKIEQVVDIELSARHMRVYQSQLQRQRQKVLGLVADVDKHRFEILKSLTILRQLSLDPGLVDAAHDDIGSAKLDRLLEDLTQVIAEGHRALVFSQFTRYLTRVKDRLDEAGIGYSYLGGRTRRRDEAIARFTDGDVPVFVISLKAGGFGLNLTQADYCFILDPWWNPAAETQAVDRTHRIGQTNPVMVYRYVATDTIEEKVMELKARKSALFDSVIDADGALSGALDDGDIRALIDIAGP
ncbi:MAG: SNF2-related protein [Microthrixaceae bacterium]